MTNETKNLPALICLKDYQQSDYFIDKTHLSVEIHNDVTLVRAKLEMRRNPKHQTKTLVLDGVNLELRSISIDGKALEKSEYRVDVESLTIEKVPAIFILETQVAIKPTENIALVGLFDHQGLMSSQCEPQGFRQITYYLDRPDILSEFFVTIEADKDRYPVLLANGNLLDKKDIPRLSSDPQTQRHSAIWHDPFLKPSYLFALVAGQLDFIEDHFMTHSGRDVTLRIYIENSEDLAKCHYAMAVTKQAMAWDEEHYGREYDLDSFMLVAVAKNNVGGQENKGLNIYRADKLLADPATTLDSDIQGLTETVAHEYFHNWSGNRVTCRDWFQLSLKEGFTTYRGRQFCHQWYSPDEQRIQEIQRMRTVQFAEDAGSLAHPIKPQAYRAISNFYTPTVYNKGAEVIRMLHITLGAEGYRQGTDLFFDRHDGEAATTEGFVAALEEGSGNDLSQYKRWYAQSGTPCVEVTGHYDEQQKTFTLSIKQDSNPPLPMPMDTLLLDPQGQVIKTANARVLDITETEQQFVFEDINALPVPSLFRAFSAPVKWTYDYSQSDLLLLLGHEPSGVCRWEASQRLWIALIKQSQENTITLPAEMIAQYRTLLDNAKNDPGNDKALTTQLLTLPSTAYLLETGAFPAPIDVIGLTTARQGIKQSFAHALKQKFEMIYEDCTSQDQESASIEAVSIKPRAMAQRALRNIALEYLVTTDDRVWLERCFQQCQSANNMTDTIAALRCLVNGPIEIAASYKQQALGAFYDRWQRQPLVINQWLKVQAECPLPNTLETVQTLLDHPAFNLNSPNQVMALIDAFCKNNPLNFHEEDGSGYRFLVDQVMVLNGINPTMASRLLARSPLINARLYSNERQGLMIAELQRLQRLPNLSCEVFEVVDKCVASPVFKQ